MCFPYVNMLNLFLAGLNFYKDVTPYPTSVHTKSFKLNA